MLILAFDTTGDRGGAGIFRDEKCLGSVENDGRASYAVLLFQMVERLLAETRHSLSDVEIFAVANGPGSFTGIRVGVAAAQGWSKAFGRPVCGVSVLAAMAKQAQPATEWVAPVLDARRGEFYLGLLQRSSNGAASQFSYQTDAPGWVLKPAQVAELIERRLPPGATLTCLARDHDQAALGLRSLLPETFRWQTASGSMLPAIARIALEAHARGRLQSPAELDALYIRRCDAEFNWKE